MFCRTALRPLFSLKLIGEIKMQSLSYLQIRTALQELKIPRGIPLLVHSSLRALKAPVEGGAQTMVDALLETLGSGGTLVVPTLSLSSVEEHHPVFDALHTPSDCGAFTQFVRSLPGAFRSCHVVSSAAAIGAHAKELTAGHLDTPCGADSPYARIIEAGGAVLFLGTDLGCNTLFHAAEEAEARPYLRYAKIRDAKITDCAGNHFIHTFRRYNCYQTGVNRYLEKMEPIFSEMGVLHRAGLGAATLTLVNAEQDFSLCRQTLREREEYLLQRN